MSYLAIKHPPLTSHFTSDNFHSICDQLAASDEHLQLVIRTYGYPPMWTRKNTFESLIHIILEQQVSLASALAALNKLKDRVKKLTPEALLALNDEEMKACYFSRQKMVYARALATAIQSKELNLRRLEKMSNDDVRQALVAVKGIGNWTVDIYLMFVLQRSDIFPFGDLAAINALKAVRQLPKDTNSERLISITEQWRPYRTVATMILWHYYLSVRRR